MSPNGITRIEELKAYLIDLDESEWYNYKDRGERYTPTQYIRPHREYILTFSNIQIFIENSFQIKRGASQIHTDTIKIFILSIVWKMCSILRKSA